MRWQRFTREVLGYADRLQVGTLITLGALLADVPHTRPLPITATSDNEQALLGKVLQAFAEHAILRGTDLKDDLEGETTELRLTLETLTLEELTRVWTALAEPYQLSASYRVQVVRIDSELESMRVHPVHRRRAHYDQIVGAH